MKITHLLFDLDNTIFDFTASSEVALKSFSDSLGLPYDQKFKDIYHDINHAAWTKFEMGLIDSTTLRRERFELTAEKFGHKIDGLIMNRKYLSQLVENPFFMDDAEHILQHFQQTHTLAAITNGLKEVQRPRLLKVGFDKYFKAIVVSDEIGVAKPDKAYFQYTWEKLNKPAKEKVLVIGDNPNSDILGANNFGFKSCLFDPKRQHKNIESNYNISSLLELKDVIV